MSILTTITGLWGSFWVKLALLLIVAGVIFYGGYHYATLKDQAKIAQYENKLNHTTEGLQEFNLTANNIIIQDVITKIKTVTKVVHDVQTVIKFVPDSSTPLSMGWVNVFNGSVQGVVPTQEQASDKTPGTDAGTALNVAVQNNGVCKKDEVIIEGWQDWYNKEQAEVQKVNKQNGVKLP